MISVAEDLNTLVIDSDIEANFSMDCADVHFDSVEVVFKNIENKLLNLIEEFQHGIIFGCVAWLTSKPILNALAKCRNVQIIVQKEDFLRPDLKVLNENFWKKDLCNQYDQLHFSLSRHKCLSPIRSLSVCDDPKVDPIRCIGNYNREGKAAFPRAHHKFLVFCRKSSVRGYVPVALWTGSFNLTYNATHSFENVLILRDKSGDNEILHAYLKEHHHLFALSEPLQWEDDWVSPEFRIGI